MRKISADYIFNITSEPIRNGVITIDEKGIIIDVSEGIQNDDQQASIEYYKGIICPGFINTHCHLELSHMRSQVSENAGMAGFIKELVGKRFDFSEGQILQSIADAEAEMMRNGIVAVGDISNNNSTFKQKAEGNLFYHTFVEIFSMDPAKAEETFAAGLKLTNELIGIDSKLSYSIVPHAPYTMSENLLKLINDYSGKSNSISSIHNQESKAENELFVYKSGTLFDTFKAMGINAELIRQTGVNSLRSTLPFLRDVPKLLLVHNTFTSEEDIQWATSKDSGLNASGLFWCTCPNANIYIENNLPDYNLFIAEKVRVTIGTDSLASNWSLSVLDELKTIIKHFPKIPLQTLLTWATKNGADFLGLDQFGTIEKGKRPGLNLLKNVSGITINENTEVLKLA